MSTARALALCCVLVAGGCGDDSTGGGGGDDDDGGGMLMADACVNLQCRVNKACPAGGKTRLMGTVFTPKGDLPLPNIRVFVPNGALTPFPTELTCDRCDGNLSGSPVVRTETNSEGKFTLENVPSGSNVPLVIQNGRWRRSFVIPSITDCADNMVPANIEIRLPRNKDEGDIPRMAVTTGNADALECLFRKMGLDDAEITTSSGTGRVHLIRSNGEDRVTFMGNTTMMSVANDWWGKAGEDVDGVVVPRLKQYDIIIHSCEGQEGLGRDRAAEAKNAMKKYADQNGRVFMSHFHHTWLEHSPDPQWSSLLTWTTNNHAGANPNLTCTGPGFTNCGEIDTTFNKARGLADWLVVPAVMGSPSLGKIQLTEVKNSASAIPNPLLADRWIYTQAPNPVTVQYMSSNTPVGPPSGAQCGKLVFTDLHVSAADSSTGGNNAGFPAGCTSTTLTPQEKALIYMMFDLAGCVGPSID